MQFSAKYPFINDYFNNALYKKTLPNSILFFGGDLNAQYEIALELARKLNCEKNGDEDCDCLNCNWIKTNTHPAVLTISKTDNKPTDDTSKTVISIKQANLVKSSLSTTSDFKRVFIFCDKNSDGTIAPLNQINFQEETANALLKIVEEGNNVTFFFLTENKEDMLQTIISRSQCFFVPSKNSYNYDFNCIEGIFTNYRNIQREDVFDTANELIELSKKYSNEQIVDSIQNYILFCLKSNPEDLSYINDLKIVETARKQLSLDMANTIVFENMCLELIK